MSQWGLPPGNPTCSVVEANMNLLSHTASIRVGPSGIVLHSEARLKLGLGQGFGGEEGTTNWRFAFCCPEDLNLGGDTDHFNNLKSIISIKIKSSSIAGSTSNGVGIWM